MRLVPVQSCLASGLYAVPSLSGLCAVSGRSGRPGSRATSRPARGGTGPSPPTLLLRPCRRRSRVPFPFLRAVAAPACRRRSCVPLPLLPRPRRRRLVRRCRPPPVSTPREVSSLRLPSPSRLLPNIQIWALALSRPLPSRLPPAERDSRRRDPCPIP